MTGDEVYYKLYLVDGKFRVACMQWFDEYDYQQDNFAVDDHGNILQFSTEDDAIKWMNTNLKPDYIADEYKRARFNMSDYLLNK